MKKNQILAVIAIVSILIGSMAFESYENKKFNEFGETSKLKEKRMKVFNNCMEKNNYEYSDLNCELCYDTALQIIPFNKEEIKEMKKKYREYIKWAKTRAIEPATEDEFIFRGVY